MVVVSVMCYDSSGGLGFIYMSSLVSMFYATSRDYERKLEDPSAFM